MTADAFCTQFFAEIRDLQPRLARWSELPESSQENLGYTLSRLLAERDEILERADSYTAQNIREADVLLLSMREQILKLMGINPDYLPSGPGDLSRSAQEALSRRES